MQAREPDLAGITVVMEVDVASSTFDALRDGSTGFAKALMDSRLKETCP